MLTVEAMGVGARVEEDASGSVAIDLECSDGTRGAIAIGLGTTLVTRVVDLHEVGETARMRTLALAACDLIVEARDRAATSATSLLAPPPAEATILDTREPPPPATPEPATPEPAPALALASPAAPTPPPESAPATVEATLSARARATLLAGPTLAGGGDLELEMVLDGFPIALLIGLGAEYARALDALGSIEGAWVEGTLGARGILDVDVLRLGAAVSGALGYARIDGTSTSPTVSARSRDALVLAVDADLSLAVAVGPLRLSLLAGVRFWALGLDGRADGRPTLGFVDAAPFVALGVGARL